MTLTDEQMQRVREIAAPAKRAIRTTSKMWHDSTRWSGEVLDESLPADQQKSYAEWIDEEIEKAILAALDDPALRGEIENAAYERAAEACERLISGDGICAADGVWIHDCAAAIRALKEE